MGKRDKFRSPACHRIHPVWGSDMVNIGLMQEAEKALDLLERMKAIDNELAEYCPHKCDGCPMKRECLGDGHLDIDYDYDIDKFIDYIDYGSRVYQEQEEREYELYKERNHIY